MLEGWGKLVEASCEFAVVSLGLAACPGRVWVLHCLRQIVLADLLGFVRKGLFCEKDVDHRIQVRISYGYLLN